MIAIWGDASLAGSIIYPVCNEGAKGDDTALDTNEKTSVRRFGAFCLVGRDRRGVDAVTNAGNDATDDELCQWCCVSLSGDLDNYTQDHDTAAHHDGTTAAKEVSQRQNEDGAEETANFVDCCYKAPHG